MNRNPRIDDERGFDDDYGYYCQPPQNNSITKLVVALLVLFGVVGVLAVQYPKLVSKIVGGKQPKIMDVSAAARIDDDSQLLANNPDEDMGDYFYNEAGGDDADVSSDTEQNEVAAETNNNADYENALNFGSGKEDNTIMVSLGQARRQNPFVPHKRATVSSLSHSEFDSVPFEIIEPPTAVTEDLNINNLLEAKITGILYDPQSPSAVVVINGVDEFVKTGDKIFGYTITSITRDKVVISYGKNTFTASIGQLFSPEDMTAGRVVPNLEKKFAGSRR